MRRGSPFILEILVETLAPNVKLLDLPKYHGDEDSKEQLTAFDNIMQLYRLSDAFFYRIFVTTLYGRAQEWFGSLVFAAVVSCDQLARKFMHHFASKKKAKRITTYLFTIRQKDDEILRTFIDRFNSQVPGVPDLRVDMMTSILIHSLKKGTLASALARDLWLMLKSYI
ncbi:UNVERIFIED_CONTAM: hypothetical protein Slati_0916100 [Sesamum latifolium]|uniref:Retrotransposon gag domain-containing protein n=1 Tax=Sesamum latifolium TaxID=2727402 RepID=A0AAW2XPE3_9LAMI